MANHFPGSSYHIVQFEFFASAMCMLAMGLRATMMLEGVGISTESYDLQNPSAFLAFSQFSFSVWFHLKARAEKPANLCF